MLRRLILAAAGIICCISGTVAKESLTLSCIPQGAAGADGNQIRRIEVEHRGNRFSVVHVAENGERIDRASQYSIHVKPDSNPPTWEGSNKRRQYLTMVGKVVHLADNSYEYVEQLYDAREGGAKIHETTAKCVAEGKAPEPPPSHAETQPKSPEISACQTISDAHERLTCYDRQYPPTQKPVTEAEAAKPSPEPAGKDAAQNLTDADLETMRSTYDKNQARFVRDFAGKTFQASLQVESITRSRTVKNRFDLTLERGISCGTDDPKIVSFITNLNKGDRVRVKGIIDDIVNGNVELAKCELSAAT